MSEILDALRRVEMQMRQVAGQSTPEGVLETLELTPTSEEVFAEATDGAPPDYEELVSLYSSLLDTVSRVRTHVATVIKEERASNQAQQDAQAEVILRLQNQVSQISQERDRLSLDYGTALSTRENEIQTLQIALREKTDLAAQADLRLKKTISNMAEWLSQWETIKNLA